MVNLAKRSYQKELLDGDAIPFEDIKQNMKELDTINTLLGGHAISIEGIKKIIQQNKNADLSKTILICEIGCGGGDNINAISQWCTKNKINASFIGIDIKSECINFAASRCKTTEVSWLISSYEKVQFIHKPDIIFSSLFCHHFVENDLLFMLGWMKDNSRLGFFINDLHRNILAYYAIKWITYFFSASYLVKNDAPLSVERGFLKHEWKLLLNNARIENFKVEWKWAFRYLITSSH